MDWTQAFTVILTIMTFMVAVLYAFYQIVKGDIKENREEFLIFRQRVEVDSERFRKETREEFSKVHALWASLLEKICNIEKQIYEIKLDQSHKKA
ncbi:MAG: hypothetical protein B7Y25_05655 [Alphaproteobacteria bacterium 16-39-46]|nr:MAG: hypothetical protein B7Y25_05655 [Alphaproteobacteria bacterium 16-39-46]OZA42583.1 MAG: hypothetical protein B7X84_05555 [Alphaproteobacteria bacterium 17-39-52]HQS84167.1 hypothetical protein [Alphaproteobacteria bacterium]HQS94028.1 hypothetical protein [Alphaproteobacteria bacterium]